MGLSAWLRCVFGSQRTGPARTRRDRLRITRAARRASLQLELLEHRATPLGGSGKYNGSFRGQTYTITQVVPHVLSINRTSAEATSSISVTFAVAFNETVTGVTPEAFQLATTGSVTAAVSSVTASSPT